MKKLVVAMEETGGIIFSRVQISRRLYTCFYTALFQSLSELSPLFFASEALPCRITTSQIRPWLLTTVKVVVYYHYH